LSGLLKSLKFRTFHIYFDVKTPTVVRKVPFEQFLASFAHFRSLFSEIEAKLQNPEVAVDTAGTPCCAVGVQFSDSQDVCECPPDNLLVYR